MSGCAAATGRSESRPNPGGALRTRLMSRRTRLVTARQVHGTTTLAVANRATVTMLRHARPMALVTNRPGLLLGVRAATECGPVLLADPS